MRRVIVLILCHALCFSAYSQTSGSVSDNFSNELQTIYEKGPIKGFSVAIVNQEGVLYERGFGYSNKAEDKRYTKSTVQNIASISKTFIGVALLKAQELGDLNLDDPVNNYLPFEVINPHFPNVPITIRQLATHTSGIRDAGSYEKFGYVLRENDHGVAKVKSNFRKPDDMMALESFLANILSTDGKWYKKGNFLKAKPGSMFSYSNVGAGLAALVLEKTTERSFNDFTKTHIFEPLNMTHSSWSNDPMDLSMQAKLYTDGGFELAPYQLVNYPDGGLITSVSDLAKYLAELISGYANKGTILNSDSFAELFRPQLMDENFKERNESAFNDEYNMGIFMGMSAQGQVGHTGGDPGVVTHMFFNSETKVGKILIVNTDLDKEGVKEFIDLWTTLGEYENKL